MSFGKIIVHTYEPGEKVKWEAFEKKVLGILLRNQVRNGGDVEKAVKAANEELAILVEHNPDQRAKISFHAEKAAQQFLEGHLNGKSGD